MKPLFAGNISGLWNDKPWFIHHVEICTAYPREYTRVFVKFVILWLYFFQFLRFNDIHLAYTEIKILSKFPSLTARKVVIFANFNAASDENFTKTKALKFQCTWLAVKLQREWSNSLKTHNVIKTLLLREDDVLCKNYVFIMLCVCQAWRYSVKSTSSKPLQKSYKYFTLCLLSLDPLFSNKYIFLYIQRRPFVTFPCMIMPDFLTGQVRGKYEALINHMPHEPSPPRVWFQWTHMVMVEISLAALTSSHQWREISRKLVRHFKK